MTIKVSKEPIADDKAGPSGKGAANPPKMTKEQIKAEQDKVAALNALVTQAQAALQSQNWPEAETVLSKIVAADPNSTRWEFYKTLGDVQVRQQKNQEAIATYEKGIPVAEAVASGIAPKDPRNPNPDPVRAKAGVAQMLSSEANCYLKLEKTDQAILSFRKAAQTDPNPALAYYNLCALAFNAHKYDDAAADCDKSAAADPAKAEAWFFKGAALAKGSKPGAADALNKYLQLDANGMHAAEAKSMLQAGAK